MEQKTVGGGSRVLAVSTRRELPMKKSSLFTTQVEEGKWKEMSKCIACGLEVMLGGTKRMSLTKSKVDFGADV